jgi:hypothetical protein
VRVERGSSGDMHASLPGPRFVFVTRLTEARPKYHPPPNPTILDTHTNMYNTTNTHRAGGPRGLRQVRAVQVQQGAQQRPALPLLRVIGAGRPHAAGDDVWRLWEAGALLR